MRRPLVPVLAAILVAACHSKHPATEPAHARSQFLFVWAGDADKQESDFLAVIDMDRQSPTYGIVVATQPAQAVGTRPHHTEHAMPAGGVLWANGFDAGRTFQFDLRDPRHPRLGGSFGDVGPFSHPHSYARLANGNMLVTFQHPAAGGHPAVAAGGLVEVDTSGNLVRFAEAQVPAIDSGVRPYSLVVVPSLNRVVTTSTDMHLQSRSRAVQIWRFSDLRLLHTILLPPGPSGDASAMTAEPRLLEDGRTVLVNTFTCGLYRLIGIDGDAPSAEWVYSTPWKEPPFCAIPIVAGHFWVQANGPEHAVVSLDISDPSHPREVGRLTLAAEEVPHWIALEPAGDRLVITGYGTIASRVLIAHFDRATGALRRDSLEVDFAREQWPHGATGRAIPHGAVFSRP